jgi:quinone-modifying oxidoreductase subunit QmoB
MEKKLGVYLCSGCSIGDALDIDALEKAALDEHKADVCKKHAFLCGPEGLQVIRSDIEKEGINTVVIGACSPRVNTDLFAFQPEVILDRVNLREHVAWCQKPKDEDTQMMAEDYLAMGIVRARKTELLEPYIAENLSSKILVVGGGLSGLTASLEAAKTGYDVVLVEKENELGGWAAGQHKMVPLAAPYSDLSENNIADLIKAVEGSDKIEVLKSAAIEQISGQPGCFDVSIKNGSGPKQDRIGTIILAAGAKEYDLSKVEKLGYGKLKNVVSASQMEAMANAGKISRPSDGNAPKSVVFVQCAGSRDKDHLPYCSAECCLNSLKQSQYLRQADPEAKAYIIYKDMRTPGHFEHYYKAAQENKGIFLSKGEIKEIKEEGQDDLIVSVENTLIGEDIEIKAEMVVLAGGMVTNAKENEILNLTYRLGKDLPELKYGFPDSHFICFPYETRRTGIYAAGAVRQPMDSAAAVEDATGAALKAIQCIVNLKQGKSVHPRSGDQSYPDILFQRCTSCKRCTEECPFGAYDEDEKGTPKPNPNRCRRCGICFGACPERVINFKNYSIEMVTSIIKCISMPEEDEEKPRVLVLMCENDAYPALDIAGIKRIQYSPFIRVLPVRCIGSVSAIFTNQALSEGFDGLLMIGCKSGDDYQCHYIKGSEILNTRGENLQEVLQKLALEPERLQPKEMSIDEYERLPKLINEFMETIDDVGANPFKDL